MTQQFDSVDNFETLVRAEERHLVTKAFLQVMLTAGLINTGNTQPIVKAVNELTETMRNAQTVGTP